MIHVGIIRYCLLLLFTLLFTTCSQNSNQQDNFRSLNLIETDTDIQIQYDGFNILGYSIATQYPADSLPNYYKRSGFIHPVKTLSGTLISDDFPRGHTHQHALFNAWTKTTFRGEEIDFWNQQNKQGTVEHSKLIETKNDIENPSFSVELSHIAYINGDTIKALHEQWDVATRYRDNYYIFDIESTIQCATTDTVYLNKYHYGGMAFRGADAWNVENNYDSICQFKTSESLNHIEGNHSRPTWASMYGKIEGKTAGIAIIQHPKNLRYPSHIRVHPSMPYFCFIPTVDEGYAIIPEEPFISRYRFVVFDGELDVDMIEKEEKDFNLN